MTSTKRLLARHFFIAVFVAVSASLAFSNSADARLTNVSPNPKDMVAIDRNGQEIEGGLSHLLKNETVAQVKTLKLGAYFTGSRSSHTLRIEHGIDGMKCLLAARLERTARNPSYIAIIIGEGSGKKVYKVPFRKGRVCNNSGTSYRNIAEGTSGDKSRNRFFGQYNIPASALKRDSATGHDFYVPITIAYSTDNPNTREQEEVEQGGSDENSVNFRARVDGRNSQLGPLGVGSLQRQFGLRSAFFKPSDPDFGNRGVRARAQFGVPCDVGNSTSGNVGLYDADTDRFGLTYLKITKGNRNNPGSPFRQNDYNTNYRPVTRNGVIVGYRYEPPNENIKWRRVSLGFESTATEGGGNRNSIIELATLEPGPPNNRNAYYFHIDNPADSNPNNIPPNANTLNVSIPFDSIYGDLSSCEYELKPDLPSTDRTYTENQVLDVTSSVRKVSGGATGRHAWQTFVARYNSMPNRNLSREYRRGNSTDDACRAVPTRTRTSCSPLFRFDQPVFPEEQSRTTAYQSNASDGNIICFFTRIQKPTNTSPADMWRYSDMFCSVLGKQPKVQIWGHDLRVGEGINTSFTNMEGDRYHSWGEYAVMSDECNVGGRATSGAEAYQGSNHPAQDLLSTSIHTLTFANTTTTDGSDQCKGNYDGNIISSFDSFRQGGPTNSTSNIVEIDRGDISLSSKRVYYYPNATVRITGNLQYGNNYNSISEIPRVVIIAKNIVVNSSVRHVDPWLIALENDGEGGKIATCDTPISRANIRSGSFPDMNEPDLLDRDTCDEQIQFNSPVMASEIYLYRTHGATGNAPARAAEVFNLRADAFLSTYSGDSDAVATTDAITELPPRF